MSIRLDTMCPLQYTPPRTAVGEEGILATIRAQKELPKEKRTYKNLRPYIPTLTDKSFVAQSPDAIYKVIQYSRKLNSEKFLDRAFLDLMKKTVRFILRTESLRTKVQNPKAGPEFSCSDGSTIVVDRLLFSVVFPNNNVFASATCKCMSKNEPTPPSSGTLTTVSQAATWNKRSIELLERFMLEGSSVPPQETVPFESVIELLELGDALGSIELKQFSLSLTGHENIDLLSSDLHRLMACEAIIQDTPLATELKKQLHGIISPEEIDQRLPKKDPNPDESVLSAARKTICDDLISRELLPWSTCDFSTRHFNKSLSRLSTGSYPNKTFTFAFSSTSVDALRTSPTVEGAIIRACLATQNITINISSQKDVDACFRLLSEGSVETLKGLQWSIPAELPPMDKFCMYIDLLKIARRMQNEALREAIFQALLQNTPSLKTPETMLLFYTRAIHDDECVVNCIASYYAGGPGCCDSQREAMAELDPKCRAVITSLEEALSSEDCESMYEMWGGKITFEEFQTMFEYCFSSSTDIYSPLISTEPSDPAPQDSIVENLARALWPLDVFETLVFERQDELKSYLFLRKKYSLPLAGYYEYKFAQNETVRAFEDMNNTLEKAL